ncbi:MAG: DUF177 domain-containing protein [Candidatus Saganbacteria bacterium]|nr:DUF177 domain-containing protein [Candidatus Saganbacteria bacterium]
MKIDLTGLLKEIGNDQDVEEQIRVSYPEDGLEITGPVQLSVHLLNAGEMVIVTGKILAEIKLNCSRCLKDFDQQITVDFEELFSKTTKNGDGRGGEKELGDDDFIFPIEKDNTIDIGEIIRQELISCIPIKTLCDKGCKGIKGCIENSKKIDPRFAKLKEDFYNAGTKEATQQHKDKQKKKG